MVVSEATFVTAVASGEALDAAAVVVVSGAALEDDSVVAAAVSDVTSAGAELAISDLFSTGAAGDASLVGCIVVSGALVVDVDLSSLEAGMSLDSIGLVCWGAELELVVSLALVGEVSADAGVLASAGLLGLISGAVVVIGDSLAVVLSDVAALVESFEAIGSTPLGLKAKISFIRETGAAVVVLLVVVVSVCAVVESEFEPEVSAAGVALVVLISA